MKTGKFECYLRGDTKLPMMYLDDCLDSVVDFMKVPSALYSSTVGICLRMIFFPVSSFVNSAKLAAMHGNDFGIFGVM